jgi:hypothetical protein
MHKRHWYIAQRPHSDYRQYSYFYMRSFDKYNHHSSWKTAENKTHPSNTNQAVRCFHRSNCLNTSFRHYNLGTHQSHRKPRPGRKLPQFRQSSRCVDHYQM